MSDLDHMRRCVNAALARLEAAEEDLEWARRYVNTVTIAAEAQRQLQARREASWAAERAGWATLVAQNDAAAQEARKRVAAAVARVASARLDLDHEGHFLAMANTKP